MWCTQKTDVFRKKNVNVSVQIYTKSFVAEVKIFYFRSSFEGITQYGQLVDNGIDVLII